MDIDRYIDINICNILMTNVKLAFLDVLSTSLCVVISNLVLGCDVFKAVIYQLCELTICLCVEIYFLLSLGSDKQQIWTWFLVHA